MTGQRGGKHRLRRLKSQVSSLNPKAASFKEGEADENASVSEPFANHRIVLVYM